MSPPRAIRAIPAIALLVGVLAASPGTAAGAESGSTIADRQQLVYELNLARWNPTAFAAESGVAWERPPARPPLATDARLAHSAQFKADEMASSGYFSHQSLATGVWPNQLARDAGYPLPAVFGELRNNIESLHSGSPVPYDVLGSFAESPTHRLHVFGEDWFGEHTEIGVGRSTTANFWVIHTAYRTGHGPAITGVVFDDLDGNGLMGLGEGLAGINVLVDGSTTITNGAGGYSIEVAPGRHVVSAFGSGFAGTTSAEVEVDTYNVGIDFTSGDPQAVVRSYQLCHGLEPTILGTAGDDVLVGTPGRDIIHGLGGRDIIDGRGGEDIVCRGEIIGPDGSSDAALPW